MLKLHLLCAWMLVLALPLFAAKTKKDEVVPVRKGKKGKVESVLAATKKTSVRTPSKLTGLHPQAQTKMNAALKDMNRIGVCPVVTSGYRSSAQQHDMYRCSHRHQCRVRRGIYGARKPGTSLHEAGLAVDLADVAHGKKRNRRLTRDGKKMVKVMQKHGFKWRYGLQDPAHFELDPRAAGFKTEKSAIAAAQQREARQRLIVQKNARAKPKPQRRRA